MRKRFKIIKRILCIFTGHNYGPIKMVNEREQYGLMIHDEIQTCSKCKHVLTLGNSRKRGRI